jgi:carbonic anhydrase/acetyltransferase-like protein (isoleucine patch superfamily)
MFYLDFSHLRLYNRTVLKRHFTEDLMGFYLTDEIEIHPSAYIAPSARIYGKVKIGAHSSIWDGVVIRGDMAPIEIGHSSSIQENAVIHVDTDTPTIIGNFVTVGHGAIIHGATVGDNCIIAIGSILLNQVKIGENSVVGAGAVVLERNVVPPRSVVFGMPGKVAKTVSEEAIKDIRKNAEVYVQLGQAYRKRSQNK